MNNTTIVALGVLCALGAISQCLTFASLGRLRSEQRELTDALIESHNSQSTQVRELSDLVLRAMDLIGGELTKSSNKGGNAQ